MNDVIEQSPSPHGPRHDEQAAGCFGTVLCQELFETSWVARHHHNRRARKAAGESTDAVLGTPHGEFIWKHHDSRERVMADGSVELVGDGAFDAVVAEVEPETLCRQYVARNNQRVRFGFLRHTRAQSIRRTE